ncbi:MULTISPECIES: SDR family NAD(P)-dependent oxidoreductase [unclassified Sphingomonas]|uniref:SDR family NAD(P)-dependent oxidoreductase n=1 Tax=unclassified Sphingomonas TaxID=196159 RepID=UPI0006FD3F8A|nr:MULTISPECIES: SDR family NAD(P)-dependent oxidoreductase [unclassified Sphingomonas]KQX25154.1 short-chain dehydrogenase [Sphingomonas sp. Root1294]KQY66171.1 short-chain dehydrogenase [Sphingomonas sp. Root50]KRB89665.1 short-chain dehydrogenase [Sphingomonas sp. Root720]
MKRLDGKRIAVTGAAGGLGRPLARLLKERGAHVVGIDRVGCPACDESIVTDLSDDASLAALARALAQDTPDILVNLAGVLRFGLHEDQPSEALALCYRVNLYVPAILAQAVAAPMRARGAGQIVNIGSVLGAIPYPWFAAYSSSKAGLAALSQSLRRELAGSGVGVTHVSPRAAKTPLNDSEVNRFLDIARMKADEPEKVARRIVEAIVQRRETVTIGWLERLYAIVNAVAPSIIDNGIAPQTRRARAEFC